MHDQCTKFMAPIILMYGVFDFLNGIPKVPHSVINTAKLILLFRFSKLFLFIYCCCFCYCFLFFSKGLLKYENIRNINKTLSVHYKIFYKTLLFFSFRCYYHRD